MKEMERANEEGEVMERKTEREREREKWSSLLRKFHVTVKSTTQRAA